MPVNLCILKLNPSFKLNLLLIQAKVNLQVLIRLLTVLLFQLATKNFPQAKILIALHREFLLGRMEEYFLLLAILIIVAVILMTVVLICVFDCCPCPSGCPSKAAKLKQPDSKSVGFDSIAELDWTQNDLKRNGSIAPQPPDYDDESVAYCDCDYKEVSCNSVRFT